MDPSRSGEALSRPWGHNHSTVLKIDSSDSVGNPLAVSIISPEGYARSFTRADASSVWITNNSNDTLSGTSTWLYRRSEDDVTQSFNSVGHLISQTERNGWITNYTYDDQRRLSVIEAPFGRIVSLSYNGTGQLVSVSSASGKSIAYTYDGIGRLSSVIYPDLKSRSFLYENASFPYALTGIVDETGSRWGTFSYDSLGRAASTELAGGADRYLVSYPSAGSAIVTDPLNTSRTYKYGALAKKLAIIEGSLPAAGRKSDAASRVQAANGLTTAETDFKGVTTTTAWDTDRRLPISVTRAVGTPEAQTSTIQWHATWALPVLVTEAGRTTANTYDAQGRPLTQTVTHTAAGNKIQTTSWTYNPQGLIATETAPNGALTSYAYDPFGNVISSTNALGQVTSYTYDSANRMLSQTEPNGLVTTYTWDIRDRLLTRTVGGQQTTALTYTPFGALATLTLPTGLSVSYNYDAAHRLSGWSNNRSESGSFTLDAMGNRIGEQIVDSAGATAWTAAHTINNTNRLTAKTNGSNQTNTFGYDANGELISETDGANATTRYGLDGLRRVKTVTKPTTALSTLTYDALDSVTQASDFKGVATTYARDAQGNATAESSTDIGTRSTTYDALGLPSQIVDALGQATTIQRDILGRPTQLTFADGKITTLRYDLTGSNYNASANASIGYLSEIQDRAGITSYQRDVFGRVVRKTQTLLNGGAGVASYSYNTAGLLSSIQYPGGADHILQSFYDGTGRLTGMNWRGEPLLTGITWNPMGQPNGWTWAFGAANGLNGVNLATTRSYDTAGRLTNVTADAQTVLSYTYNSAGRVASLSQLLVEPSQSWDPNSPLSLNMRTWNVRYNGHSAIDSFNRTGTPTVTADYSYDDNGSLASAQRNRGGVESNRYYRFAANRYASFDQSIGGTWTSVTFAYNANGDMTGDGLRTYTYDAEGRLATATTGATDSSPTTRYAHNALGQRVFKTEPLYPPSQGDEAAPGFWSGLVAFFSKLWSPATTEAEQLGFAYVYDENGSLISEAGSGGANSAGESQYIYLPTANGPMPIVAVINGNTYAVHSDHLNTPRRLSNAEGQAVWQWSYSAFGEDKPTIAKYRFADLEVTPNPGTTNISEVKFNLRYPGQYADEESGLFYNGFRTYDPRLGRYTQGDPIGLDGGWNRFGYVYGNALSYVDPLGLQVPMPPPPMPWAPGTPNPGLEGSKNIANQLSRAIEGRDKREKTYQTYTRWNPLTGQCYTGRTSGYGTPQENIRDRAYGQPLLNAEKFLPPVLDRSSSSYNAIRGREQQVMELNGGARSSGGDSRNMINGISPGNLAGPLIYIPSANREFGPPVPAGRCTCQ
ncbi:RHS repeat-associated core domain-containing protein [Variovorax sp. CCNWLW225]|uniref:RHS repeat-associated core domain-containing protein n=1 Tax=Variovorax sp. CCNWLW225 TaxID=3127462 RepID=UPI003076A1D4